MAVQVWANFLQRFETDRGKKGGEGAASAAGGGLQLSMARRDAEGVIGAMRRWLKDQKKEKERLLSRWAEEQGEAEARRRRTRERVRVRRLELKEAIGEVEEQKARCLAEMLTKIEEYQALGGRLLKVAAEDQRCVQVERELRREEVRAEKEVSDDEAKSGALVVRLDKGMDASNELQAKVQLAIESIDQAIRGEKAAWSMAEKKLTCEAYNGLFCRLFSLVLLVASRHKVPSCTRLLNVPRSIRLSRHVEMTCVRDHVVP